MSNSVKAPTAAQQAATLLGAAQDVTLVAHVQPDADALGSALALGLALHRRGTTVRVSFGAPAQAPESLRGLDVAGLIVPPEQVPARPEVLVALDTASRSRLGCLADRIDTAGAVLVIDHHATNDRFGTHHLVDTGADATAVLVLQVLDALDVVLDEPVARCIYAGLVTDTSCFRRADPITHAIAGRLLAAGVDSEVLTRELLDTHPFGWLPMLATVLGRAQLEPASAQGLGLVHTTIRLADAAGLRAEEIESVVDLVRTTSEAEVAAVLKEVGPDQWSVSLRAKSRIDVSAAAARLGGGGHRLAAGLTADGTDGDVLDALRTALRHAPRLQAPTR
ncbi:MAG TPA: DHH family phosphoesterase [Pseudonocardiaceae bacterium]|nr:DHH family phosphoesterase [Pseudonocardiaceae bacterium]